MATNLVYKYSEDKTRVWDLGSTKAPGVPVKSVSNQPAVTITGTGNYTKTETVGPFTVSGIPAGGVGLDGNEATVATDGTWDLAVTGVTLTTPNNTVVHLLTNGNLSLSTGTDSIPFGVIDYPKDYVKAAGRGPVKIGVFA